MVERGKGKEGVRGERESLRVVLAFPPVGTGSDLERLKVRLVASALRSNQGRL